MFIQEYGDAAKEEVCGGQKSVRVDVIQYDMEGRVIDNRSISTLQIPGAAAGAVRR